MKQNSESLCTALSPLAEVLRVQVAKYQETLTLFKKERTKELAEKLVRIAGDIQTTEMNINEMFSPFGYSLDAPLTPIKITERLRSAGSKAELATLAEGEGVVFVDIDPNTNEDLKTLETAMHALEKATARYLSYTPEVLEEWVLEPLTNVVFDAIVVTYDKYPKIRKSSDKIVEDMAKAGYRPATLTELFAVGITNPDLYKGTGKYLDTLNVQDTFYCCPSFGWNGSGKLHLAGGVWEAEWTEGSSFLFVRKSDESKS
jgi:hypothetical protein